MPQIYDDGDVLTILEDIYFSPRSSPAEDMFGTSSFNRSSESDARTSSTAPATGSTGTTKPPTNRRHLEDAPQVQSTPAQPAVINGVKEASLKILRPTKTLKELQMRIENTHQRFITREGVDIFLERDVLKRIDFEEIRKKKGHEKTLNLPDRYQVRVRLLADGTLKFFHYHKRGVVKRLNRLNQAVQ